MKEKEFFEKYPSVAIAFSGGVDSAYLLYLAKKYAKEVCAFYVKSDFQPEFELADARRLAEELDVTMEEISLDALADEEIVKNPANRCYYCKRRIMSAIQKAAAEKGFSVLLEGTNASDQVEDRPGMKALSELRILSPLREFGFTKSMIRAFSKEAGLFTYDKPSYACLATRIPTNTRIEKEMLEKTERAEKFLSGLGFLDFRVRLLPMADKHGAVLELKEEQIALLVENREMIVKELKKDYTKVLFNLEVRGEE